MACRICEQTLFANKIPKVKACIREDPKVKACIREDTKAKYVSKDTGKLGFVCSIKVIVDTHLYASSHFTKMSATVIKDTIAFMLHTKFQKFKHGAA